MTEINNTVKPHLFTRLWASFNKRQHIAPLVVLRIAFGTIMLISTVRFVLKGWVYDFYIAPKFFFPFYGFEWVRPLPAVGMYLLFAVMAVASLFVLIGFLYRISISVFFASFVYVELIDKTYYLNHYYFVSIITFLLLLVPAHRYFSVDVMRKPSLKVTHVPGWTINIFKWQLVFIYFCAGISKLNYDWMFNALPLKIWLPANGDMPVIGPLLRQTWVAYLFSWFGAVFDISIGFLLLNKRTRGVAYIFVVIFHVFTGWLFKIGMFPYIMIFTTVIFFSEEYHLKFIRRLQHILSIRPLQHMELPISYNPPVARRTILYCILGLYVSLQLVLPFRYLLYPGALFWTEEGYRFSWRVMLMEKSGTSFFYVKDHATGRRGEVNNAKYLTPLQEKMMSTQPDMILQYAHYLKDVYTKKGIKDPIITTECYVTLNGSGSMLYVDSTIDLSKEKESLLSKKWILPFHQNLNK